MAVWRQERLKLAEADVQKVAILKIVPERRPKRYCRARRPADHSWHPNDAVDAEQISNWPEMIRVCGKEYAEPTLSVTST